MATNSISDLKETVTKGKRAAKMSNTEADIAALTVKVENANKVGDCNSKDIQAIEVDNARTAIILENLVTTSKQLVTDLYGTAGNPGMISEVKSSGDFIRSVKRVIWIGAGVVITTTIANLYAAYLMYVQLNP